MTWSYPFSCCFVHLSCASSAALQTFCSLFTVSLAFIYFIHLYKRFLQVIWQSYFPATIQMEFFNPFQTCFSSGSAISKVQSPLTRTSRRNQSKAKSRPAEPEVDLQLLKTLCNENDCNTEEVRAPSQDIFLSHHGDLFLNHLVCFCLVRCNCIYRWRMYIRPVSQLSWTHWICQDLQISLR